MTTLVVKNLPDALHQRLRDQAQRNHRSITKEAIVILEQGLVPNLPQRQAIKLAPPIKLKTGSVTTEWIEAAIADGRD